MRSYSVAASVLLTAAQVAASATFKTTAAPRQVREEPIMIAPKVFIISMFAPEADVWYENLPSSGLGDLLAVNISSPGLSMLFPYIHCTADYEICQVTTGESEINAAASVSAVAFSAKFNLTATYFLIAGIAGVSPKRATTGAVAFNRFAVQVALQYEVDARELPANFTTGYFGLGAEQPGALPTAWYGTEVFELNDRLRRRAAALASAATLADSAAAAAYRARYAAGAGADAGAFAAGARAPAVVLCDGATSDVYFSGARLADAFDATTALWTGGAGEYCVTAQEDSATLAALLRAAAARRADFARVVVMRAGSDFDRPPAGAPAVEHLLRGGGAAAAQGALAIALANLYRAGVEVVRGVLAEWACAFRDGVPPANYVGDVFGSLGGVPGFGPGARAGGDQALPAGGAGDLPRRGRTGEAAVRHGTSR